jgi:hypothetical protein
VDLMISESLIELSKIEDEIRAQREKRDEIDAQLKVLFQRQDAAITERLAELTDEQILGDPALRSWALSVHGYHQGAYRRVRRLATPAIPEIIINGVDGREGYEDHLRPTVALEHNSDLSVVGAELVLWERTWGMGRPDLPIDVLEHTLSAHGSYTIRWAPSANVAVLRRNRSEVFAGSLRAVLAYVAKHHPYNNGRYDDEGD